MKYKIRTQSGEYLGTFVAENELDALCQMVNQTDDLTNPLIQNYEVELVLSTETVIETLPAEDDTDE